MADPIASRTTRASTRFWLVFAAVAALCAVGFWLVRQVRGREAIALLPAVDVSRLEPEMIEIIELTRAKLRRSPLSGPTWGEFASVLLAQDFVSEGAVCYGLAARFDPNDVRWPYLEGLCLERVDADLAFECFRRAAEIETELATPKVKYAEYLLARRRVGDAEKVLRTTFSLAPNDPRVLFAMAQVAFLQNRTADALRWANQAVRYDPHRRRIHMLLSQIHQRSGDAKALEHDLIALDVIPETDWPDGMLEPVSDYRRGMAWIVQLVQHWISAGMTERALQELNRRGGRDAKDVRIVVLTGKALMRTGQLDEAADVLKQAIARDATQAPAHFELGNLALLRERPEQAITHYRNAIRFDVQLSAAHYNLGLALRATQDRNGALRAFQDACRVSTDKQNAYREAGALLLELNRRDEARHYLQRAELLLPQDPTTRALLLKLNTPVTNS